LVWLANPDLEARADFPRTQNTHFSRSARENSRVLIHRIGTKTATASQRSTKEEASGSPIFLRFTLNGKHTERQKKGGWGQAATQPPDTAPAPTDTADTPKSSNFVTILDSRNTPTETELQETATTEVSASPTPVAQPAVDNAEMSASPELVRPNPPAPNS
jgi:hypothetical protein